MQFSANPLLEALARGETNVLLAAASQSGTVGVGEADNVASLRGEVFGRVTRQLDYVGVMAMPPERLEGLPNEGCLIGDFILPQLRRGERVAVVETSSVWRDVGTVPSYWQANLSWLKTHAGEGQSWVGKGARMAVGVELKCSVVGAGARIEGRGFLENCVVWPDAVVVAPLRDAVVTRLGRVVQL